MLPKIARLRDELRKAMLLLASYERGEQQAETMKCWDGVCTLALKNQLYTDIWDEGILLQLKRLFHIIMPNETQWGEDLKKINEQALKVKQINDFFFGIISKDFPEDKLFECLSSIANVSEVETITLRGTEELRKIRSLKVSPSEKIEAFIEYVKADLGIDFGEIENAIIFVLTSVKEYEKSATPNALLIDRVNNAGAVIPLQIHLRQGSGSVNFIVSGGERFRSAVNRARQCLVDSGFLQATMDVTCSMSITDADYHGDSICLPAAAGIYLAAGRLPIDPYTAFTGNINLEEGEYKIKGVTGIDAKLDAAVLNGCRRVFIPKENSSGINTSLDRDLTIIPVDSIREVFSELQSPVCLLREGSLQNRKINTLGAYCEAKGWPLYVPKYIESGLQFIVSPPNPPKLVINVYNTGSHTPKERDEPHFQELLNRLNGLDESSIPILSINKKMDVADKQTQELIRKTLGGLGPVDRKDEPHCLYSYRFEAQKEKVTVKQYNKGTLQFQGKAGSLFKGILESVFASYKLSHPNASLSIDDFMTDGSITESSSNHDAGKAALDEVAIPHIGTDESGKGDYFGSMVVAGVWMDRAIERELDRLGVKDSKQLSDKRCREVADELRNVCRGKYEVIEIPPVTYNKLYDDFRKEGKNLNHLLAWGHARAIENLLNRNPCSCAVADQFGDEKFILSKLMEKGKKVDLIQIHKGERYPAVAAASILARDRFLNSLKKLSQECGIDLPKGASITVVSVGKQLVKAKGAKKLGSVGKLHHKTSQKILGKS